VGYELLSRPDSSHNTENFYRNIEALNIQADIDRRNVDSTLPILLRLPPGLFLSINVSPGSLLQKGFTHHLLRKLSPHANRVVLEITERNPMVCTSPVLHKIEMLRKFGFSIALDDVGAGYNNLLGLIRIRPQMVKVAKTLISGMAQDPFRAEAVRSIVQLARKMHAVVVAEGVERREDVEALSFLKIEMIQGFLFHVPEPADAVMGRWDAIGEVAPVGMTSG
jgi:EAL domain-containing protein (putative c-di-GMP-specific phosphodiesterase class I)